MSFMRKIRRRKTKARKREIEVKVKRALKTTRKRRMRT